MLTYLLEWEVELSLSFSLSDRYCRMGERACSESEMFMGIIEEMW